MKFDIKNMSDNVTELYVYGEIVSDESWNFSFDDQYPSSVRDFLAENRGKEVHVKINSPGGSCFAGICIGEMLKNHDGKTIAYVDGICASIATYIASCCNEVRVHDASYWMMHNAWVGVAGNKNDLAETIALLEKMDNSIAEAYMKHSKKSEEEIKEMMDKETWLCGKEILDTFDFIIDENEIEAYAKVSEELMNKYKNVPSKIKNNQTDVIEDVVEEEEPQDDIVTEDSNDIDKEELANEELVKAQKELAFLQAKMFIDNYK